MAFVTDALQWVEVQQQNPNLASITAQALCLQVKLCFEMILQAVWQKTINMHQF